MFNVPNNQVEVIESASTLNKYTHNSDRLDLSVSLFEQFDIPSIPYIGDTVAISKDDYEGAETRHLVTRILGYFTQSQLPQKILLVNRADLILKLQSLKAGTSKAGGESSNPSRDKFEELLRHAIRNKTNDIQVQCCEADDISFADLKVDGSIRPDLRFDFVNYVQGWSMLCAIYDNATGKQSGGSLNTVDNQETDIKYHLKNSITVGRDDSMQKIKSVKLRFTKTVPDRLAKKTYTSIRILVNQNIGTLEGKGYPQELLDALKVNIRKGQGFIVTSGPVGSGKSTLMFGALNYFPDNKVMQTIEDPVEYEANRTNIIQNQVDEKDKLGFMKSIVRLSPDGVLVGEIRDDATRQLAFEVVNTSHLCLSTLHAKSVVGIVERFLDLGASAKSLSEQGVLSVLIAQRLVSKVCQKCSVTLDNSHHDEHLYLKSLNVNPTKSIRVSQLNPACNACEGTGYIGRQPLIEFRIITQSDRDYIREGNLKGWAQHLQNTGFNSIDTQARSKLEAGIICPETANKIIGE